MTSTRTTGCGSESSRDSWPPSLSPRTNVSFKLPAFLHVEQTETRNLCSLLHGQQTVRGWYKDKGGLQRMVRRTCSMNLGQESILFKWIMTHDSQYLGIYLALVNTIPLQCLRLRKVDLHIGLVSRRRGRSQSQRRGGDIFLWRHGQLSGGLNKLFENPSLANQTRAKYTDSHVVGERVRDTPNHLFRGKERLHEIEPYSSVARMRRDASKKGKMSICPARPRSLWYETKFHFRLDNILIYIVVA